ncbi:MAG: anti-sigma factor family protein [Gemmatimonadales bacterium]
MTSADGNGNRGATPVVVFPPDCEQTIRGLWDYLDRALDAPTMAAIDAHLARCGYCRAHAAFEQTLIARLHGLRRECDDPVRLRTRVLGALHAAGMPRGQHE